MGTTIANSAGYFDTTITIPSADSVPTLHIDRRLTNKTNHHSMGNTNKPTYTNTYTFNNTSTNTKPHPNPNTTTYSNTDTNAESQ